MKTQLALDETGDFYVLPLQQEIPLLSLMWANIDEDEVLDYKLVKLYEPVLERIRTILTNHENVLFSAIQQTWNGTDLWRAYALNFTGTVENDEWALKLMEYLDTPEYKVLVTGVVKLRDPYADYATIDLPDSNHFELYLYQQLPTFATNAAIVRKLHVNIILHDIENPE